MTKAFVFSFLMAISISYSATVKLPVKLPAKLPAHLPNKINDTVAPSPELKKVLKKYSSAKSIDVDLVKTDEKTTLGTKTTSHGNMKYNEGKIYLVLESDKKVEFYYKDKKINLVEYPDQDFDKNGKRKVTILTKNKPALISGLLDLFSNTDRFLKNFEVLSEKKEKDKLTAHLKPHIQNLKEFTLVIDTSRNLIESIIFVDEIDTKTTLELRNLKTDLHIAKSTFEFKSIKSDEVIPE